MGLFARSPDGRGRARLPRRAARLAEHEIGRYFDESLELLFTADATGRLLRVSPAWKRCLGHGAEGMCGRPLTEFVHVEDRDAAVAEMLSLADGSAVGVMTRSRFETLEGGFVSLEWRARLSAGDGRIRGSAHDVTAQRRAELHLADEARRLQTMVDERTRDLNEARAETLQLLAVASEFRDDETAQHTERIGELAAEIGTRIGLSEESVVLLREAAPLHDIGKLAIPDSVLLKPGRLSEQEQELMQTHTTLGARLLFGSRSPALQLAGVVAESHHERWDGHGYPLGLIGSDIPLVGPHRGRRGRVRRAHARAPVQARLAGGSGGGADPLGGGQPVRPARGRGVPGDLGRRRRPPGRCGPGPERRRRKTGHGGHGNPGTQRLGRERADRSGKSRGPRASAQEAWRRAFGVRSRSRWRSTTLTISLTI